MKKALLVTRVSGFIPQHERNNVKILQEMGYEVHYATNLKQVVYGKDNSRLEGTGIITHQIDFEKSPFSKNVKKAERQLVKLMEQETFDLIHCHMPLSAVVARRAAQKVRKKTGRKVPVLYTAHGFHFYKGAPVKNWIYYPIERHYARYTDRLILINREDYERGKKFPVRGRVEYVPGVGIDLGKWKDQEDRMMHARKSKEKHHIRSLIKQEIKETTKVIVDVGELSRNKNQMLLVEMMGQLRDLDLICLICGLGEEEPDLRKKIRDMGLEEQVFLVGYVEDVQAVLNEADCFVLTSRREGLPVSVMEAMAAGLPVVAGKIRGVTDLLEDGQGGYLVCDFQAEAYAEKVRKLFGMAAEEAQEKRENRKNEIISPEEKRRKEMGTWNKRRIENFSIGIVEKRMKEIYTGVVDEMR